MLVVDSRSVSRVVARSDEQAEANAIPHDELILLQHGAEEARISDGMV